MATQPKGRLRKTPIKRPESNAAEHGRCQKMSVQPTDSGSPQPMTFDELKHFIVLCFHDQWQVNQPV